MTDCGAYRVCNARFAVAEIAQDSNLNEAVAHAAKLRDWHGRDGGDFRNDTFLYRALADGKGVGKWFIPPKELLCGTNQDDRTVFDNSLFALKNTGDFAVEPHCFDTSGSGGSGKYPGWYWSCSEHRDYLSYVWVTWFSDGHKDLTNKDNIAETITALVS